VAYSGGSAKYLYGGTADPDGCLPASPASTVDAVTTSPVIAGGKVFVVTAKAGASTLRRFADDGTGEASLPTSCGTVVAPPAADGNGDVLLACGTGEIERANRSTLATTALATLPDLAAESIVILPGGDLVVGTNDGKVHRLAPPASGGTVAWTDAWNPPPDLGAAVTGVLVAAPDAAGQGAVVYAVTESGDLHALDAQGATVWTTAGSLGNFSLRFPTIAPALPGRLPTLYAGSAEGKLYAVVADTGLDTLSPWPKSHHDIRNTGNASAPLP
jgi:outer membrane protein assembly factor BamB